MNNRLLRPITDALRYVYLFLFTRGQDQIVTQDGNLLRAEQGIQSDTYGAGLPVTITELPSGTASADMVLAVDTADATITQKITLGSIPGLAPPQAHTHDDRYYTETEVNSFLAGKSDTTHTHSAATTTVAGFLSAADKTKLDGIASNATANSTDAQLRDRSTHTGTQAASTITGLAAVATSGAYSSLTGTPTLGTIATQNANAVAITGGTISGTTIGATTASTGAFTTVTTTGNVGIGTASPSFPLDVAGTGVRITNFSTLPAVVLGRQSGGTLSAPTATTTNSQLFALGAGGYGASAYSVSSAVVRMYATENYTDTAQGSAIAFETTPNGSAATAKLERLRIDSNGNVGIGTVSPATRLHVTGTGAAGYGTELRLTDNAATGNNGDVSISAVRSGVGYHSMTIGPSLDIKFKTGGDSTNMVIASTGNVGIGTGSPSSLLHVQRTIDANDWNAITVANSGGWSAAVGKAALINVTDGTGTIGKFGVTYDVSGRGAFVVRSLFSGGYGASGDVLYVRGDGNVGIGTGSPQNRLHVDAASNFSPLAVGGSDAVSGIQFRNTGATLGYIYYDTTPSMIFHVAASEKMRILTNGNVGIGTASPTISSGVGLHIAGSTIRLGTARTPASSTATGNTGEICWDSSFLYVCVATNSWRRIALSTF